MYPTMAGQWKEGFWVVDAVKQPMGIKFEPILKSRNNLSCTPSQVHFSFFQWLVTI